MAKEADTNRGLALFETPRVRREWHSGQWFFSVTDIIQVLTDSPNPRRYWSDLKIRLKEEGSQLYAKIVQLKMLSSDGKKYLTDCCSTEISLRLIQSVPSPHAEPLKIWLANVGKDRIDEIKDPELAVNRAKEIYEKKGYPRNWIDTRMRSINVRNTLTDEWRERGVKTSNEFAILTNEIYKGTFDMTKQEYKDHKSLDKEDNLRDHMGDVELILTMLGEASTTEITRARDSKEFHELNRDAKEGGSVAGNARKELESKTGKTAISDTKFIPNKILDEKSRG